jgi:hypothetical protein
MHSYADTFEQPVVEKYLNGDGSEHEITIKLLTQRDYQPWIDELTPKAIERARKNAPPATRAQERANYLAVVENMEVTPEGIRPLIFRVSGTQRILKMALMKSGMDEKAAENFIDSRPAIFSRMCESMNRIIKAATNSPRTADDECEEQREGRVPTF